MADHSWPDHCCEGSAHYLTAEMLITQSHQEIQLCSLMTLAIASKALCKLIRRPHISNGI